MLSVSGYDIDGVVQAGRELIVHRGRRLADDTPVLIKSPRSDRPTRPALATLQREQAILAAVDDDRVTRVLAALPSSHGLSLILEDIGGQPLRQVCDRGPLPTAEFLAIALAITDAVATIHDHGIVHRDLRPETILHEPGGRVAITGFGRASPLSRADEPIDAGNDPPIYSAPEQSGRLNRPVDARSDLYALGVVFYELLTGAPPFVGDNPLELVHAHVARPPASLRSVVGGVPEAIEGIVLKLLAKSADERYQTADGLRVDLDRCRVALEESGSIAAFTLGELDRAPRLTVADRLYGAEQLIHRLLSAHERALHGERELILLGGAAGMGKSRALRELFRLFHGRGLILFGRCDGEDDPPYAAITSAVRSRARELLAAEDDELAAWRTELHRVVGDAGAVLCPLFPEMTAILRPQSVPPELPPSESVQRIETLVDGMLRTLACGRPALVLLVDDAHWIDPSAAAALARLLGDRRARATLIVATHAGELAEGHPLRAAARAAAAAGARVSEERLAPLTLADTAALLRESLTPTALSVRGLAEHVHARSGGNPLFLRVLLARLHEEGLVRFDRRAAAWTWIEPREEATAGDLVAVLRARIGELPSSSQAVLEAAACVGRRFEVDVVARVLGRASGAILDDLEAALQRQIVRLSGEVGDTTPSYVFTHARVHEALYAGVDEARRRAVHVTIGEHLRREGGEVDDRIFAAVSHLNRATEVAVTEEGRVSLARANLRAGRRAALAGAAAAASRYLSRALALMPEDGWRSHHELMRSIHLALVEALSHQGEATRAAALFDRALAEARSDLDRAEILAIRVSLEFGDLRFADALSTARVALRLVGVDLPARGARRSFALELAKVRWRLRRRSARAFLNATASVDRRNHLAHRLLMYVMPAVHHLDPRLTAIVLLRLAALTLERGRTEFSPYGVAGYGMVQSAVLGEYAGAQESLQIADTMLRQTPQPWIEPKIDFLAGFLILPWVQPLAEARRRLDAGHRGALQRGDLLYAALCGDAIPPFALLAGDELSAVQAASSELLPIAQKIRDAIGIGVLTAVDRLCRALRGIAEDPTLLGANADDDAALLAAARRNTVSGFLVPLYKAIALYHAGAHAEALPFLERASTSRIAVQGTPLPADLDLYAALALAEVALKAEAPARRRHLTAIGAHVAGLAKMASASAENFGPRWRIAAAMAAWVGGDDDSVLPGLGQAILDARAQGDPMREGLAAELAARFAQHHEVSFLVDDYASVAVEAYGKLGASARVEAIRRAYGGGADAEANEPPPEEAPGVLVDLGSGKSLDLSTVIKATQALSSEIVLDRLLTNLLRIVMENAGARRCFLVLEHEGRLSIEAEGAVDPERIEVLQSIPLDAHPRLPLSIINYVARSSSTVVLDHAAQRGSYTKDEYVREQGLKSVLCLPILQNNRVSGVLYLENNLATGVFTAERLELLNQLAAQVAISVENARLYESLDRARQVAVAADQAKTRFLMTMSHELRTPLNAIIGYTELIEEELEDGHIGSFADDLGSVRTAALRLERTLQSTLELSRIEAGTFEIEWETVHLHDIVRDVINELRPAALERAVTLEIAVPGGLPPITADRVRIRYVLLSLLDNAIRFSEGTPVELIVRWALDGAAPILEVLVRDHGIGIADEHMPQIFKSFSQADGSTTRLYEGSGVSLAVTQHICARMGGTIAVESVVGEGSTFMIRLPVQPAL